MSPVSASTGFAGFLAHQGLDKQGLQPRKPVVAEVRNLAEEHNLVGVRNPLEGHNQEVVAAAEGQIQSVTGVHILVEVVVVEGHILVVAEEHILTVGAVVGEHILVVVGEHILVVAGEHILAVVGVHNRFVVVYIRVAAGVHKSVAAGVYILVDLGYSLAAVVEEQRILVVVVLDPIVDRNILVVEVRSLVVGPFVLQVKQCNLAVKVLAQAAGQCILVEGPGFVVPGFVLIEDL